MDTDDLEPVKTTPEQRNLEDMSIAALKETSPKLEQETARACEDIAAKEAVQATSRGGSSRRDAPPALAPDIVRLATSVSILTKVSQRACVLRFWGNDEDIGMHLAVSRGAGDAGRVGFWAEHAAEAGLAGTDRVAVG